MVSFNIFCLIFCCFVALNVVTADNEFVFDFGDPNRGYIVDQQEGVIPLLSYENDFTVHVPSNVRVTYVRVTVEAVSSPKVDFDKSTNTVSLSYSWTQVTLSKYKILAKGERVYN